ncbi:hypothetical protein O181_096750 [Austropuccinia psidii MF-1]|uniref:Reverse transcriptase RNase H-like domain-containing protein n=1 Tax=Austropuccinia psidii MF-1 TaxID=1389203 RepID=A0A9Q3J884_9BASI|nr:hypothetical protein [Austropuccinia psidii MF-1]
MLFLLKASRWTKQKSSRSPTGLLQETSRLFNHSLALPISTAVSSRIIQKRSVHSQVSSRKIPVSPPIRKLSVSFTNSKRLSVSSVKYLGYVVSSEGLKMDQAKVQQILNWPLPRNLEALQSFLGFANFYPHFIKYYSKKTSSLISFLRKDSCFALNEEALKTNASNYALGAVLSQVYDSGAHPIAFDSCKLIPAELNYEIHYKELFAIVWALKRWRDFLLSLSSPFEVLTDHSSLQYFMTSKVLTCPEAGWAEFLSEFYISITYRPGCLATLLDALSCQDNIYPESGEHLISKNPMNFQLIKQDEVQPSRYFAVKLESFSKLIKSIQKKL